MTHDYNGPERRRIERTGWRATWFGKIAGRIWFVVSYGNTIQTRLLLCVAAALWAGALLMPGESRPAFEYMGAIATEVWWVVAFGTYSTVLFIRIFSDWNGRIVGIVINAFGAALFSAVAAAVVVTLPGITFPAGAAPHIALAIAAVWVLIRTHVHSPRDWQHD